MLRSSQQTAAVSNKQVFPAPVQEAVFSFRNFRVLREYKAMGAI